MPFTLSLCLFIVFNVLVGAYTIYMLRGVMRHISTSKPQTRTRWYLIRTLVRVNQLTFCSALVLYTLSEFDIQTQALYPVAVYSFLLTGTLNYFFVFFLMPFYIAHEQINPKKNAVIISGATILASIYAIPFATFSLNLLNELENTDLFRFYNPLPETISAPLFVTFVFGILTTVYLLHILCDLRTSHKGWKRFIIHCMTLGASINFFIYCCRTFEIILALLPTNLMTTAYFTGYDRGEIMMFLMPIFILPIINLFFISIFTPFYAYTKLHQNTSYT